MHLILTHEQADFDAIASLLAASLLDPEALPVLPRRLNRNVRAFLTLYSAGLPFVEFGDLPRRRVEGLTIVDSQSLFSVKGVDQDTRIHVVDHHPVDQELDPSWTTHIEAVGATTTLLAEVLQEEGVELDLISSTILILGIHEDTGSLSYPGTTPRDVRATAWLLESGASLAIVSDFLNHPLSSEQHRLFNQLFEAAETFQFHGLSVVIASGSAEGMVDEVSTLAHKLGDVFDPDGLIVLVTVDGNVQMVGRSSTDTLDVGRIAGHFGGGGHSRAAAAMIRDSSIQKVRDQLLSYLPVAIEPVKTVGEIMSRGPQLLHPDERIIEASERMQRFGHEGYPVVDEGVVIGLLTRRAVDRAIAHTMDDRPVSTIMDAGDLVVYPEESIQHLQRVMIKYGWGQVPVADAESREIIGIVTRTDLLKTLGAAAESETLASRIDQLEQVLPIPRLSLLKLVARQAMHHNDALYIVGGFVRDLLLGAPSVDFDLVVEGDAIKLARKLGETYGGRISSHRRFGTAKWRLDWTDTNLLQALEVASIDSGDLLQSLDFVSARTEFYAHPTALPSVERSSIKLDLHRRDFTINTLALRLDGRFYGQLLDHWGGGRDLHERLIRVLHSLSFVDDPTRMLRAVRLEQRLNFQIEHRTLELLEQALPLMDRVSGERIRNELNLIFTEKLRSETMERLQELGLLSAIHPALVWDKWLEIHFNGAEQFSPPERWRLKDPPTLEFLLFTLLSFRLPEDQVAAVCARLHFPISMVDEILEANHLGRELPPLISGSSASNLAACMEGCREGSLVAAWLASRDDPPTRKAIDRFLAEWRFITPGVDGDTLKDLGLPPGPEYRRILWALRAAWIDGGINSAEEEAAMLHRLIKKAGYRD